MKDSGLDNVLIMLIIYTPTILCTLWLFQREKDPRSKEPAPPPPESRLSFMAAMSFFCGLIALLAIMTTQILSACVWYGDLTGVRRSDRQELLLAERIVNFSALVPAVGAVAFWIGARSVVRGSDGRMRGRALYRTGAILAAVTAFLALQTNSSFSNLLAKPLVGSEPPPAEQGYLGVEVERTGEAVEPAARVKGVVDGSPAAKAGVQVGDIILNVDGTRVTEFNFAAEIGSRPPGTVATLSIQRQNEALAIPVTLDPPPLTRLLELLRQQNFDGEREAVLRVASGYRRFTTAELIQVCGTFKFDEGRMEAIRLALPGLTDLENSYQLLGALRFSDSKSTVSGWLNQRRVTK